MLDGASQSNTVQADDLVNKCCSGRDCTVIGIAQAVLGSVEFLVPLSVGS